MSPAPTKTYEEGVAFALGRLTRDELLMLASRIHGTDDTPVDTAIARMDEDGYINSGWIYDVAVEPVDQFYRDSPDAAGIVAVATLAAFEPGYRNNEADWAAFEIYRRIIGVEIPGID